MKKKEIDGICREEAKVQLTKEWLGILFFVATIIVAFVYYKAISFAVNVPDPLLTMEYDKIALGVIIIALTIFASLLVSGYFYNIFLSKKLDRLWGQKQLLL